MKEYLGVNKSDFNSEIPISNILNCFEDRTLINIAYDEKSVIFYSEANSKTIEKIKKYFTNKEIYNLKITININGHLYIFKDEDYKKEIIKELLILKDKKTKEIKDIEKKLQKLKYKKEEVLF